MFASKLFLALAAATSALAAPTADPQTVTLPVRLSSGSIIQTYPDDTRPLYDYIDDTIGSPLRVVDTSLIRPINGILGTQFNFVPVQSSYMGYKQSLAEAYGHVVLSSNTSLALTLSTTAEKKLIPRLAPVVTADSSLQLDQFWSYEPSSGILLFLGSIYHEETFAPVGYAPVAPAAVPGNVEVTNVFATKGRFVFKGGKATSPCPTLVPYPPPATVKVREARQEVGSGGVVCPVS